MSAELPVFMDIAFDAIDLPAMVIRLRCDVENPSHVDFEIHEAFGRTIDGAPLWFTQPGRNLGTGETQSLDEACPDVEGFVKRSGCTQLGFSDDGYAIHYDDVAGLARMMDAIKRAQVEAYRILKVDEC